MLSLKAGKHRIEESMETTNRIRFKVFDGVYKDLKEVTYDKQKDIWTCTCYYWSVRQRECSHIRCVKLKGYHREVFSRGGG